MLVCNIGENAISTSATYIFLKKSGNVLSCRGTRPKWGSTQKIHLAVDAHGLLFRFFITAATVTDCSVAKAPISNFSAKYLLADRGYDTVAIIRCALQAGMTPEIPPKKNLTVHLNYDKYIYKLRHLVENAFLHLKRWRGIVTRYAKKVASFVAAVQIRCIALLLKLY